MNIYSPKVLTERTIKKFRPTRLAIKELAGQFYFCKSTKQDIQQYSGSGVVWRDRIKKYGKDRINTIWVSEWYSDPHQIQKDALKFSEDNQIVESKLWANCKPEDGLDGGATRNGMTGRVVLNSTRNKISKANSGKTQTLEHRHKNSIANSGSDNPMFNKTHSIEARKKMSMNRKNRPSPTKGKLFTEEQRKRISEGVRAVEKLRCVHCGTLSSPGNHIRWHNNNCKSKSS